ncbi:DUF1294 domain-containing protein [Novosphingobium sp. G106]|nr:DUF1294 domain-containing protein [Novosphingobium sp. G106]
MTALTNLVITLNLLTFVAFSIDKLKAETGRRRIRETTLLLLALLGGTPGAYAGRALFRHKTRKQPFSGRLHTIAAVQLAALAAGSAWLLGG